MRVLSDADVEAVLSLAELLPVVERAFVKQGRSEVERPPRPHFPVGDPPGTALVMPAAIAGAETFATKVATVHESNPERGLPTVRAQVHVTDAATGAFRATMDGSRLTNARTGCIGGLAARELVAGEPPYRLGVVGAGAQARWQTRAIATAVDLDAVCLYSPTPESREACAADLSSEGVAESVDAVASPEAAVADADIVVTATTATEPVFSGAALAPGALVVAVGAYTAEMCELDAETVEGAARVFADVPEEVADVGAIRGRLTADELVPLSDVFEGEAGRERDDERLVVKSVGSAVLDAAAAEHIYERAESEGVGTVVDA